MANTYEEFITLVRSAEEDVVKGYGGNRAAATRARKTLLEARKALNEVRKEVLATGKGPENGGETPREVSAQLASE